VDLAGGDEGVNPRAARVPDGLPRGVDVLLIAPREAADDGHVAVLPDGRVPDLDGDGAHGVEVVGGGGREAGLDDVDAEAGELAGHDELLGAGHGGAGGLLAVAERGVEDADVVGVVDAVGDVLGPPPRRLLLRRPDGAGQRAEAARAGARSDGDGGEVMGESGGGGAGCGWGRGWQAVGDGSGGFGGGVAGFSGGGEDGGGHGRRGELRVSLSGEAKVNLTLVHSSLQRWKLVYFIW